MSTFESELENLLGEFHIKMKGRFFKEKEKVGADDKFVLANVHSVLRCVNLPM